MPNILHTQKLVPLNQEQRFAMFVERNRTIKKIFESKLGDIHTRQKNYSNYCYMMFVMDAIQALDRSSQVIFYHHLKRIDIKATCTVTSLSVESIDRICEVKSKEWLEQVQQFDYASVNDRMHETKTFVNDLLNCSLTDVEIIKNYQIDIGSIKILRIAAKIFFKK